MGVWKALTGTVLFEITSASTAQMLCALNNTGIRLYEIECIDELRVRVIVDQADAKRLQAFLQGRGDEVRVLKTRGFFRLLANLKQRPIMVTGVLLLLFLSFYLPTRVYFVRVEGNRTVPSRLIVEKAEACGIKLGASRREIHSEKMKNALLSAIPQLQWAGVNTSGCVAVISVQERTESNPTEKSSEISSIVAARDGIIRSMVVLEGNPICKVGQAVKTGQVLVSGYTDCGLIIKTSASDAEIRAQTKRELQVVTPAEYTVRSGDITEKRKYRLCIGKNIINFCKDSGIPDTRCVKMYEEKFLTLPGGFALPVSILIERTIFYSDYEQVQMDEGAFHWVSSAAEAYLLEQMQAGEILTSGGSAYLQNGLYCLNNDYSCMEMIGVVRKERFVLSDGKRN